MAEMSEYASKRIKELLEKLLALPFTARENGLGPEERDMAEAHIWMELKSLTGARDTCSICGQMYHINDGHICD